MKIHSCTDSLSSHERVHSLWHAGLLYLALSVLRFSEVPLLPFAAGAAGKLLLSPHLAAPVCSGQISKIPCSSGRMPVLQRGSSKCKQPPPTHTSRSPPPVI